MPEKVIEPVRRRKWAPKARTGCKTCKTRHVKCDETKPICRRCVLSGFRCDGYPDPPPREDDDGSSSPEEKPKRKSRAKAGQGTAASKVEGAEAIDIEIKTEADPPVDEAEPAAGSVDKPPSKSLIHISTPSTPYTTENEQRALSFFVDMTAPMVGRSRSAPYFWAQLVPQAAWQHPAARHAMMAAATMHEALYTRTTSTPALVNVERQVMSHAHRSINHLLTQKTPLDVIMLTSATLGILDLFNGQWKNACTHVTSGAKLAEQARLDPVNNAYVTFYCQAFASALPTVLKKANGKSAMDKPEPHVIIRLLEGIQSLELAQASFESCAHKISQLEDNVTTSRIIAVLYISQREVQELRASWQALLQKEIALDPTMIKEPMDSERVGSPWDTVTHELDIFLDHGGCLDVAKFEIAMERTLPFFMFAKSGSHIGMREEAVKLMAFGVGLRRGLLQDTPASRRTSIMSQESSRSLPYNPPNS